MWWGCKPMKTILGYRWEVMKHRGWILSAGSFLVTGRHHDSSNFLSYHTHHGQEGTNQGPRPHESGPGAYALMGNFQISLSSILGTHQENAPTWRANQRWPMPRVSVVAVDRPWASPCWGWIIRCRYNKVWARIDLVAPWDLPSQPSSFYFFLLRKVLLLLQFAS